VRGPLAIWRHTHLVEPIDSRRSLYEDRVEYAVRGGRLVNLLAAPLVRPLLRLSFARRHKIVRDSIALRRSEADADERA
jgi:ligand-binding SRPBCC domain-containing protein